MPRTTPLIQPVGTHRTIHFAAQELARHLRLATGKSIRITEDESDKSPILRLGVCGALGIAPPNDLAAGDDWILIRPLNSSGGYLISGSNPRSVLIAAYRFLRAIGFRWLRPGERGIVIPKLRHPLPRRRLRIDERPSYKFRTVCIEGASSVEHVLDMIDWLPKAGMNGYFIQFRYATTFLQHWYEHHWSGRGNSPYLKRTPCGEREVRQHIARIEAAIAERDLNFERVGHGWTCAALGIPGESWDRAELSTIAPEKIDWLAQVNGKKELWHGVPVNTNLNYANPLVRDAVTDAIADYAAQHPEAHLIHFWLADGSNNHDERPESLVARPSDFYVDMLNELDAKLSARNLATRIVCLIYVDLLWPPIRARVKSQDRFVLMFAPITRTYLRSFLDADPSGEKPAPFVRNQLKFPRSLKTNLHFLAQWRKHLRGDAFDFDYHGLWAPSFDPFHFTLARTLHRDIQQLQEVGLHGFNSCQVQRLSFPHHLLMEVMSRTLWDRRISFQRIVRETFSDAFGRSGMKVARHFEESSRLWRPMFEPVYVAKGYVRDPKAPLHADSRRIASARRHIPRLAALNAKLKKLVDRELPRAHGAMKWSWQYLKYHTRLVDLLLPAMLAYLDADPAFATRMAKVHDYLWRTEKVLHPALDVFLATQTLETRVQELRRFTESHPTHPA